MIILDVAKLAIYGMFLNYYCYYVIKGSFIPYGTAIFFALACVCVFVSAIKDRAIRVGDEVRYWSIYLILSLGTAIFALDSNYAVSSLVKYGQRLVLIMLIAYICEKEGSIKFALRLIAVTAVACAASVLHMVDDIQQKLSIASSANLSANDVGALMAFGSFAVLVAFGRRYYSSIFTAAFKFASVIALIAVIFLAGSRKSIYAVVILFVLLLLLCGKDYGKRLSFLQVVVLVLLGAVTFSFINQYLAPHIEETNLYVRLFGRGAEAAAASDEGRVELYVLALKEFMQHPITGLGFNNFAVAHGNYTHSTYAEPLACTGIIGILYLIPYVRILKRQIYLIKANRSHSDECLRQKELLAFYIAFLFIGIGIPYMYKDIPCIILGMFIASQYNSYHRLFNGIFKEE